MLVNVVVCKPSTIKLTPNSYLVSRRVRASHDTERILDRPPIVLLLSRFRFLSSAAEASPPPPSPPFLRGEQGADPLAPVEEDEEEGVSENDIEGGTLNA